MILYHGSNQDIKEIDLTKTRPNKDFGQGFYLTADKEQAMQMAKQKVVQSGGTPTVNVYEFDENHLSDNELNIKIFEGYTEEWARFILANRNRESKTKIHDFDIVIGAIADDKVGVQLFRYMKKYIDLPTFSEELAVCETNYPVLFWNGAGNQIIEEAMTDDEQFMIECITTELTEYVMRDYHIGMKEALDMVYNSETYSKLIDMNSGLYYQSPLLVYDVFKEEQITNRKKLNDGK